MTCLIGVSMHRQEKNNTNDDYTHTHHFAGIKNTGLLEGIQLSRIDDRQNY